MKLIKIKFTHWRDRGAGPRTPASQRQFDYFATRVGVLSRAAADLQAAERTHADNTGLQKSIARINADLQNVEAERTLLLLQEAAERSVACVAARQHKRVGTFGYQILDESGTRVIRVVDEAGNDLPDKAVYSYELAEIDRPMAATMKGSRAVEGYVSE